MLLIDVKSSLETGKKSSLQIRAHKTYLSTVQKKGADEVGG